MKKAINLVFVITFILFVFPGCSKGAHPTPVKTFVLIHGAWQAPYVWDNVKTGLERAGQRVVVVELPAHGDDTTSPATVSIDVYRDKVVDAINKLNCKVILVGHSLGGVVVSAVAEKIPSEIEKLVYIGAFVPSNGQSLFDLAGADQQSLLGPALLFSEDHLLIDVARDSIVNIFCQDAPPAIQQLVIGKYRAEPAIPFTNKVVLTDANFGKADKYYIYTLLDHAIGIDNQHAMSDAAHITHTYSLNTGHSPFLSQPGNVTKLLLEIAK